MDGQEARGKRGVDRNRSERVSGAMRDRVLWECYITQKSDGSQSTRL
jgi:hypothetical protein